MESIKLLHYSVEVGRISAQCYVAVWWDLLSFPNINLSNSPPLTRDTEQQIEIVLFGITILSSFYDIPSF